MKYNRDTTNVQYKYQLDDKTNKKFDKYKYNSHTIKIQIQLKYNTNTTEIQYKYN